MCSVHILYMFSDSLEIEINGKLIFSKAGFQTVQYSYPSRLKDSCEKITCFFVHGMELICAETSKGISFSRGYCRDHKVGKQGKISYDKYFDILISLL
jgi:hypothetical protein